MANHIEVTNTKTYANEANMIKAINRVMNLDKMDVRWYTAWTKEGRCFPVFIGMKAVELGIHFHFNIVA